MTLKSSSGGASELEWTRSSFSTNDGPECVEVAWAKSSYSAGNNNDCIEVSTSDDVILVRDSKDPDGPRLTLTPAAWNAFVEFSRTM